MRCRGSNWACPHPCIPFNIHFNIIMPSRSWFPKRFVLLRCFAWNFLSIFHLPCVLHSPTFVIFSHWDCYYFLIYSGEGEQYHGGLAVFLHRCILTHPFWHIPVTSETRTKRVSLALVITRLSLPVHSFVVRTAAGDVGEIVAGDS